MAIPYVGEIRMFAGNFAPAGWAICDGSLLPISENEVLFQLIGVTYGGDGQSTFALPDLRGRTPVHMGQSGSGTFVLGEQFGSESVTLTAAQMPAHTHSLLASANTATTRDPIGNVPAEASIDAYVDDLSPAALNASAISSVGGSQPHENMMPYLCINFIISLFGIFPSPT